eukprot:TRINITY_DN5398_c0_g1_i1.p1 TRINITY_DN5398_c0_g1~~TRINITY_DN5398_c0_g1_i1.p1  ORF type:complete len:447 (-),score=107.92 TRINITY_DN5398_c0_g1_i1:11-1351(-)
MDEAKREGNDAFHRGDYAAAAAAYARAIACCSSGCSLADVLHCNRCLALRRAGLLAEACTAVNESLKLNPTMAKAHFHKASVLLELAGDDTADCAHALLRRAWRHCALLPPGAESDRLRAAVSRRYFPRYYGQLCEGLRTVRVEYFGGERGKGVAAREDVAAWRTAFAETPLVSRAKPGSTLELQTCAQCMRSFVVEEQLPTGPQGSYAARLAAVFHVLQQSELSQGRGFCRCAHCAAEVYCSEECKRVAWESHHKLLCSGGNQGHPYAKLYAECAEAGRVNPLLIARMLAGTLIRLGHAKAQLSWECGNAAQRAVLEAERDTFALDKASEWLEVFVGAPCPSDDDAMFTEHIRLAISGNTSALGWSWLADATLTQVVNVDQFRRLNGVLMQNASQVHPVSDLHLAFEAALKRDFDAGASGATVSVLGVPFGVWRIGTHANFQSLS